MVALSIYLDGDRIWPDLAEKRQQGKLIVVKTPIGIAALAKGTQSGNASVAIRVDLPDGKVVFAETSLALFLQAAEVFRAKHPSETPARRPPPAKLDEAWNELTDDDEEGTN